MDKSSESLKPRSQWLFGVSNYAMRLSLRMFADLEVENRERLEVSGPTIVVSNHLSNLDPPIVAAVMPRKPLFLAKREIFSNPVFAFLLKSWGAFPVNRSTADLRALNWACEILETDRLLVLFPEGTRSRDMEGLKRGQLGATLIASQSGATVVPIGIYGTEPLQNVLRVLCPSLDVRISVGKAFKMALPSHDRRSLSKATDEVMMRIARELPPSYQGLYSGRVSDEFVYTRTLEDSGVEVDVEDDDGDDGDSGEADVSVSEGADGTP